MVAENLLKKKFILRQKERESISRGEAAREGDSEPEAGPTQSV